MRNLLNRRRDECERLQDLLESPAAADMLGGSIEELVESLPADGRGRPRLSRHLRRGRSLLVCGYATGGIWRQQTEKLIPAGIPVRS